MPFNFLIQAINTADEQLLFAATVWFLAIMVAAIAFKKFTR